LIEFKLDVVTVLELEGKFREAEALLGKILASSAEPQRTVVQSRLAVLKSKQSQPQPTVTKESRSKQPASKRT